MNADDLDLALKKQRLLWKSAGLRRQMAHHAAGLAPAFAAADRVQRGALWLRRHPQVGVAAVVGLIVARPGRALRWARRAFFTWQAWQRLQRWLAAPRA